MAGSEVYVLGGYQTDFARNWTKEKKHFSALMRESVLGALAACGIDPELAQRMEKKSLQRSKFFDWRETARRTLEVYSEVTGQNGRRLHVGEKELIAR